MLLVDDLAAGGTKNLRHTPRGLVTLYTDVWGFHIIFFSLQNGQKNRYPSICPRILLICFNESCRVCSFKGGKLIKK